MIIFSYIKELKYDNHIQYRQSQIYISQLRTRNTKPNNKHQHHHTIRNKQRRKHIILNITIPILDQLTIDNHANVNINNGIEYAEYQYADGLGMAVLLFMCSDLKTNLEHSEAEVQDHGQ